MLNRGSFEEKPLHVCHYYFCGALQAIRKKYKEHAHYQKIIRSLFVISSFVKFQDDLSLLKMSIGHTTKSIPFLNFHSLTNDKVF